MLPNLLIGIGILLSSIGIIGMLLVAWEPIDSAFEVAFKKKDDYVFYETKKGKELLARSIKTVVITFSIVTAIGLITLMIGLFLKYANHGNASFFSENNAGVSSGMNSFTNQQAEGITDSGKYISDSGREYSYWIKISGKSINCCGTVFTDLNSFEETLVTLDRSSTIYVIDDFATSSTYKAVKKLIADKGYSCESDYDQK